MEAQSPYLFVYGTLMQAFDNLFAVKLRARATFLGVGFFPGRLYRVSWYPGAVYEPENVTRVWGEIYQLHDFHTLMQELDNYEDVKEKESESLYVRRQVPVQGENGELLSCWTYLYNQSLTDSMLLIDGKFAT